MSDMVGNPEDPFPHYAAHLSRTRQNDPNIPCTQLIILGNAPNQEASRGINIGKIGKLISKLAEDDDAHCQIFDSLTFETFDWTSQFCLKCLLDDFKTLAGEEMGCDKKKRGRPKRDDYDCWWCTSCTK